MVSIGVQLVSLVDQAVNVALSAFSLELSALSLSLQRCVISSPAYGNCHPFSRRANRQAMTATTSTPASRTDHSTIRRIGSGFGSGDSRCGPPRTSCEPCGITQRSRLFSRCRPMPSKRAATFTFSGSTAALPKARVKGPLPRATKKRSWGR